ncbi:LruC domain-containing protein [Mucilaginibacter auburnensis]|uniref:LruC domain-containing protein n=1 Tax=Mucilaginibacter auburnensis TaxID=1457233 RepID=A0A2H9VSN3_9SPHI|nr:LruC domain-containing protein [Mucilaginibacter auburnensis]PJJ83841.1 LruC domain-containing protein [Mucilaginibacter auburnensis]
MKKLLHLCLAVGIIAATASCRKSSNQPPDPGGNVVKAAPDGFNFSSSKNVNVSITLRDNNDGPLKGIVLSIYPTDNTSPGAAIFKGVTDASGKITATVAVPAYYTRLIIDPAYVGLMRNVTVSLNGSSVTAVIGGKAGYSGDIVPDAINDSPVTTTSSGGRQINGLLATEYVYPTGYTASNAFSAPTNQGKPVYLETTPDIIPQSLLSFVNSSLPEGQTVPNLHPEYLSNNATRVVNVTARADVWITFVSEGAGYQNVLGFYTYKTGSPPSASGGGTLFGGIDKITYIFPNASAYGSGGGLKSGDKVKLGTFDAGTTIGFVLLQNAWTGSGVNTSATKFFTQDEFNPENTSALRKHSVMLYDNLNKVYLMGFEDLNRQTGGSDNDFNDLVFYATSNPITAISNAGVAVIDDGGDRDGDGVLDELDAFPDDGTRAYVSYYPSASKMATLAFEDNWPTKGDYDLNDLVVNYRYSFTSNASNQVVELKGEYQVAAAGASFKNGFGVQLPVAANAVTSVDGQLKSAAPYVTYAANGVEAGQSKAVIIPFDNPDLLIKNPDNSFFVNTRPDKEKVSNGATATVVVKFGSPVASSVLTATAFNPFLISNGRRGYEAHLPGYAPTDKANIQFFGQADDDSRPGQNRYYVTKENLPWGISFSEGFSYPIEGANISASYLHFNDWALSGGTSYTDWYTNTNAGYRASGNIYSK